MILMATNDEGYYIKNGDSFNRPTKQLEFTTEDTNVDATNFANYMDNNFSSFNEKTGYIPQGTTGILLTSDMMYVARFIERTGNINPNNGWYQGDWFLMAKVKRVQA
jgi:hypothetical protein